MVETGGTSSALLLSALVFLIVLAAAILSGTLLYIARVRARTKVGDERAPTLLPASPARGIESAAPPFSGPDESESAEPPPVKPPGQPGEVMRVIRDEQTGRILVEVRGQRYAHIREIADAQMGRRVLWAIADLIRFTGGMAANPQAVKSAAQHAAQVQGITLAQEKDVPKSTQTPPAASAAARPTLPESRPPTPPPSAKAIIPQEPQIASAQPGPSYSMLAFFQRGLQPPAPSTSLPGPSSFVVEIEDILQDLIRQRTAPLSHEVHVSTGRQDQLQIEVGREVYGSANEVPDPEVQALIRAAVAEWEKH